MSILSRLSEGIVNRDLRKEGDALLKKWEETGLLEGLQTQRDKETMSVLLENQTKQLLKEASAMSSGDVEGFAAVAFPIVRRVFGKLIANELVSVQPMSLPSGLLFYLDFTFTDTKGSGGAVAGQSLFGGGVVGSQLSGGVSLDQAVDSQGLWQVEQGAYSLNNGYASPTGSVAASLTLLAVRSGSGTWDKRLGGAGVGGAGDATYVSLGDALIQHDPDLSGSVIGVYKASKSQFSNLDADNLVTIHADLTGTMANLHVVRRLTREDPLSGSNQLLVVVASPSSGAVDSTTSPDVAGDARGGITMTYAAKDAFAAGGAVGSVVGTTPWGLEGTAELAGASGTNDDIREIDIKVDSVAVTAQTKKLKAKWTPELGQDLSAYHNLDAEVELTSILSEQIALEIDQEILNDLVKGAKAGTRYWSRRPGKFVDNNGLDVTSDGNRLPDFTGTVSEWYETLLEKINDVSAQIHRKTLRGGASFLVTSPEVASILEMTNGFRAEVSVDQDKGSAGVLKVGSLQRKWDVYVDPYFVRNLILIGRKGSSFLESGYVYAPYVPLQITPTVFGTEDFVPRKSVMTRYAKKMTRADMYGLVVVVDLV